MWLIAGLGNPGGGYAGNRHNVGFMLADELAGHYRFSSYSSKHQSQLAQGEIAGEKIFLCKPQSFMNLSGGAVAAVAKFHKILPERVLVLHDELDLPLGKIRIKQGGGHGGHNGLRDIDRHLGQNYWRMRIGIGHPGHKDAVHHYVLSDFGKQEKTLLELLLRTLSEELPVLLAQGHEAYMTKIALATGDSGTKKTTSPAKKENTHGI